MSILIETVENGKEGSGNVPVEVLDHLTDEFGQQFCVDDDPN